MSIETTQTQIVTISDTSIYVITAGIAASSGGSSTPGGSNGQLQYNNAGAFDGASASAYAATGTHLTLTAQTATDKVLALKAAASHSANLAEFQNSGGTSFLSIGAPTLAGDSADKNFLGMSATMPATMTAQTNAIKIDLTTAGSSVQQQNGILLNLGAGYSGGSPVNGLQVINSVAGTGAGYGNSSSTNVYRTSNSNVAIRSTMSASTSGINNGGQLAAYGSSTANYGNWCTATSSMNSPALNVGVMATALGATNNCAGIFSLTGSGTPSISNAALIADNGATTGDIFVARDNGAAIFTIADGGTLSGSAIANTQLEAPGFSVDGGGSVISTGKVKGFFTSAYAGVITGWSIVADTGTVTVKVWKIAGGTAKPTAANSINTAGVSLATGTAIRSSTLTDFTTTIVNAGDIFAYNIEAASSVTEMTFNLHIRKI